MVKKISPPLGTNYIVSWALTQWYGMAAPSHFKNVLLLHLAIFCIATSGPLGRVIAMPATVVIFWRAALASVVFMVLLKLQRQQLWIEDRRDRYLILGGGVLIALHWVTYFISLQLSSVAIGMLSLFTYPVITAVLEPLLLKTRFQATHLLLGSLTLLGIYFLVPEFDLANGQVQAIAWGVFSATIYALRNILMKRQVSRYSGTIIMYHHMLAVSLVLLPFLFWEGTGDIQMAWPYIALLAVITTALGHTLFLRSFSHFSITTASIVSCVQPVYGIVLGIIFLKEYPGWSTYLGGGIILFAVLIESLRVRKQVG